VTVRPEIAVAIERARQQGVVPLSELGPDGARQTHVEQSRLVSGPPAAVAEVRDVAIDGPGGAVPARTFRPETPQRPGAVLYFHGGGWVTGTLDTYDALARALAEAAGAVVVLVDYRLAPEHPFPAALQDSAAALRWLPQHAAELGADPDRLAVAGDSAGGNLATVVARQARDAGGPALRHQVLVYPALDPTTSSASFRELSDDYLLSTADMRWYWHQYLGCADPAHPDIAPARADLAGLPPATVLTAEYDPLRDEGEDYARRLDDAGVPVDLHRIGGVIHGFFRWRAVTPAAGEAMETAGAALRKALAPPR
jgi:acetyl esterase